MPDFEVRSIYAPTEVKVDEQRNVGIIEAFASIFGNVDSYGDRMMPGSFKRTLAEWADKGDPIPVIFSHQWDNPMAYLGEVVAAEERTIGPKQGLWYRGEIDLSRPAVAHTFALLKRRLVTQQSFAFRAQRVQYVEEDGEAWPIREVYDVDLYELGPTLLGANNETELIQAASARRRQAAEQLHRGPGDAPRTVDPVKQARVVELLSRPQHSLERAK
jgi:HK97 family phage prohead protease